MAKVETGSGGVALTAAHVATALVAACRHLNMDPAAAFDAGKRAGRARRIAAAGCIARLGLAKATAARVFKVEALRLAPTKLKAAGIEADDLLVVAEALESGGLTVGDDGAARFRRAYEPPVETPAAARPAPPARRVEAAPAGPARTDTGKAAARPGRVPFAARQGDWRDGRRTDGPPPQARPAAVRRVARLKPITDDIVRWTRQQMRLGVASAFMAELFSVDADALARAVAPMAEAA